MELERDQITEQQANETQEDVTQPQDENVVLTGEQYGKLLDRLAELEEKATSKPQKAYTLDEIAKEGTYKPYPTPKSAEAPIDWDQVSNKDLADIVVEKVNEVLNREGNKIITEIETLKTLREIDKCESKHSDFWEYSDTIYQIAMRTPGISVEDAYQLAKAQGGGSKSDKSSSDKKDTVIYNLPPRPKVASGEKPGSSVPLSSLSSKQPNTVKDAAEMAWDDIMKNKDK